MVRTGAADGPWSSSVILDSFVPAIERTMIATNFNVFLEDDNVHAHKFCKKIWSVL
jgi:hypothetical protein